MTYRTSPHRHSVDEPAARFIDTHLIGNGRLGAAVHGGVGTESLDLNADTFWSGGPLTDDAYLDRADLIEAMREAIAGGQPDIADELARQLQGPGYSESFQPIGRLRWSFGPSTDTERYERTLDVRDAIARTRYGHGPGKVETTVFASHPADVIVAEVTGAATSDPSVTIDCPHPHSVSAWDDGSARWTSVLGRAPAHVLPDYVNDPHPVRYASDETDADGLVAAGMGFAVVVASQPTPGGHRLLIAIETGFRGWDQRPTADLDLLQALAVATATNAMRHSTGELLREHVADHRSLFDRTGLVLTGRSSDQAALDRACYFFNLGKYLLIAGSRPGSQALGLQGIWNADVRPPWSGNYTTNINTPMNYWPAEPLALGELHEPLLDLVSQLCVAGRRTALSYYGADGACAHHNTDLWRFSTPVYGDPQFANWPTSLLWLAAHAWQHAQFHPNDPKAHRRALEIHDAATRFALDLLVPDETGALVTSPSTSPEHRYRMSSGVTAVTRGCTMDQSLTREVLSHFRSLADCVPPGTVDRTLADRCAAALSRLRGLPITDGLLAEWGDGQTPEEPGHRHLSHLYAAFPGEGIAPDDGSVWSAAQRALAARLAAGSGYTGWSQAWILCLASRFRDADTVHRSLQILLDDLTSASMLDLHPHPEWPEGWVLQIDGNLGATAGMIEAIIQGHGDRISVLPALPGQWESGELTGIAVPGGHVVDVRWSSREIAEVRVRAAVDLELTVELPATGACSVSGEDGPVASSSRQTEDGRTTITFDARRGSPYDIVSNP